VTGFGSLGQSVQAGIRLLKKKCNGLIAKARQAGSQKHFRSRIHVYKLKVLLQKQDGSSQVFEQMTGQFRSRVHAFLKLDECF
jgi:hypothetical protein